jgi:hypothetical protein
MKVEDQAKRDLDLIHRYHGSFHGIGLMLDLEFQPKYPSGWGGWVMSARDVARYSATIRQHSPLKIGEYQGWKYQPNNELTRPGLGNRPEVRLFVRCQGQAAPVDP